MTATPDRVFSVLRAVLDAMSKSAYASLDSARKEHDASAMRFYSRLAVIVWDGLKAIEQQEQEAGRASEEMPCQLSPSAKSAEPKAARDRAPSATAVSAYSDAASAQSQPSTTGARAANPHAALSAAVEELRKQCAYHEDSDDPDEPCVAREAKAVLRAFDSLPTQQQAGSFEEGWNKAIEAAVKVALELTVAADLLGIGNAVQIVERKMIAGKIRSLIRPNPANKREDGM